MRFKDTLFRRYSNVNQLLETMDFEELREFIVFMFDEINEEKLYDFYIHKWIEKSFNDWKKEINKTSNKSLKNNKNHGVMSKEEEKENIKKAELILGRIRG